MGHDRFYAKFLKLLYFTNFEGNLINADMKIVETNLWQSLNPVSQTKVFWKPFRLLGSITSKWVPLLDLKQIAYFTKFERLYIYSSDQKNDCFYYTLDQVC